jgi:uncharacterized protein YutD
MMPKLIPAVTADQLRHHGVFKSREFRQKMVKLKDKTNVVVPEASQFGCSPFEDVFVLKEHIAPCWPVQPAEQMK